MLRKELEQAGISENEAKIYLAALELGESNISRIAKKAVIKRTTAYLIVDALRTKGLINTFKKRNKTVFVAEDPRKIQEKMAERKIAIDAIMPDLLALSNTLDKKPGIRYFEGSGGIKDLFKDMLKYPGQEVLEWYSEAYVQDFEEEFFSGYFTPRRVANKIWVRAILPDNVIIRKLVGQNEKQLRKTKLLDPEKYDIKIEMNIYGNNKVSIISFQEKIGLIIESKKIHDSMKNIFELMWEYVPSQKMSV
ncbi:MAG: hypothetical protein HGA33_05405 [Candidatus Moranbacteria bacterium]|nr:hypothetical protein [Candidatus Moranbacteria bacterium]